MDADLVKQAAEWIGTLEQLQLMLAKSDGLRLASMRLSISVPSEGNYEVYVPLSEVALKNILTTQINAYKSVLNKAGVDVKE